jgi:hypothetical protein
MIGLMERDITSRWPRKKDSALLSMQRPSLKHSFPLLHEKTTSHKEFLLRSLFTGYTGR